MVRKVLLFLFIFTVQSLFLSTNLFAKELLIPPIGSESKKGINPITISLIEFKNKTVNYNGSVQHIEATNVPLSVDVEYSPTNLINAGTYTVTAKFYYEGAEIAQKKAKLTINKVNFGNIVQFKKKTVTYDGSEHEIVLSGAMPPNSTVTYNNNKHTDVGDYRARAVLEGANYKKSTRYNNLIILKAEIENISLNNNKFSYDGTPKSLQITGDLPNGTTVTYSNNNQTQPGTYTVTATIDGGKNYENLTLTATLTIEKDTIIAPTPSLEKVIFADKTVSYDGKVQSIEATNVPKGVTVTYSPTGITQVGIHTITATFTYNGNVIGTKKAVLTIKNQTVTPPTLDLVVFEDKTVPYNEVAQTIEATNIPVGVTVTYDKKDLINAGVYTITATFSFNGNVIGTKKAVLTIEQIAFGNIVQFKKKTVTYDGSEHEIVLSGTMPPNSTAEYENNKHTDAGDYKAKVVLEGINYKKSTRYNNLVILKAEIKDIVFSSGSFVYDGTPKSLQITGDLPNGATVTYSNNDQTQIGTYTVTATIDGGKNYDNLILTATLTIEKDTIIDPTPSLEKVVFADKTVSYDGSVQSIEATNVPKGVTVTYSPTGITQVGIHTITATFTYNGNVIGTKKAILTIEKQTVTPPTLDLVVFEDKTVSYDGSVQSIEATNVPKGVTVTYSPTGITQVGTHTITATFTYNGNVIGTKKAILTIEKKTVTPPTLDLVVFKDKTVPYNEVAQTIEATNLPVGVTVTYDKKDLINAGVYTITATFSFNGNVIGTKKAVLTIEQIAFGNIVQFKKKTVTYDGNEHEITLSGTMPPNSTAEYENNKHTDAGDYKAKVVLEGINYKKSTRYNNLVILKAEIKDIVFSSGSFVYDGTPKSLQITGNLPNGVIVTYSNNDQTQIGTYTVTATIDGGKNYKNQVLKAILRITKNKVTPPSLDNIVFEDKTVDFDGNPHRIIATNIPNNVDVIYEPYVHTDAGIYTMKTTYIFEEQEIGSKTAVLTINAIPFNQQIVLNNKTVIYNEKEHQLFISGKLPENTTIEYVNNIQTEVGTYLVEATLQAKNYITKTINAELIINKAELNRLTFNDATYRYDGTVKSLKVSGRIPNDLVISYVNNNQIQVGSYTVIATIDGGNNYHNTTFTATLTISDVEDTKPSLNDIVFEDKTVKYNKGIQTIEATNLPSGVTVSYFPNLLEDAGEYIVTATFMYNNTVIGVRKAALIIEKIPFDSSIQLQRKLVYYNGQEQELLIIGTLPEGTTATYVNNKHKNTGTYEVDVTLSGKNYITTRKTNFFSILKAKIAGLIFKDQTFKYDGQPKSLMVSGNIPSEVNITYNNNEQTEIGKYLITASIDGGKNYYNTQLTATLTIEADPDLPSLDKVKFENSTVTFDHLPHNIIATNIPANTTVDYDLKDLINAGNYTITATFTYKNRVIGVKKATLTINQAKITGVQFLQKKVKYDGNEHELTITGILPIGAIATYLTPNKFTEVGTYSVDVELSGSNYITEKRNNKLIIEKGDIKGITLTDASFEYDGKVKELVINGDLPTEATVTYVNNKQTEVGTYKVTATINSGKNYNDLVLDANLAITKATIKGITLTDASFEYDGKVKELAINGILPTGVTVTYVNNKQTEVGTYKVTATINGGKNYNDLVLDANLTITKATIKGSTLTDASFEYDGKVKELVINGDLPTEATVTYTNNKQIEVGTYKVTATINGGKNYNDLVLDANLTITKATIKGITLTDASFEYDGKVKELAINGTLPTGVTVAYTNNKQTEVGTYKVTATINGGKNYNDLVLEANLTITKNELNSNNSIEVLKIGNQTYNNPKQVIEYVVDCYNNANYLNIEIVKLPKGATAIQGNNIKVDLTKAGTKTTEITIKAEDGQLKKYTIKIVKSINASLVVIQKFNNVLLANNNSNTNGGYNFNAYKWFKNGKLISEKQFYSAGETEKDILDANAVYTVELTTVNGEVITSCPIDIKISKSKSITLYPNPVDKNETFNLNFDYQEEEFTGAHLSIISITGQLIYEQNIDRVQNTIQLPNKAIASGKYIAVIKMAKETKSIQFIIK
ncbi:MAG: MBG domain-containing protein [Flavobacteriaceae bacterium]|jgi:hypothetical protein|nr:MBG domain-containing protein [Flavobacteriaceae bacterium]